MNPSQKVDLNRQLNALTKRIDESIAAVEERAIIQKMDPAKMMYADGHHVLAPLLLAKAEALNALVNLNVKDK